MTEFIMQTPVTVSSQFQIKVDVFNVFFFQFIVCISKAEKCNTNTRRGRWVSIYKDNIITIL